MPEATRAVHELPRPSVIGVVRTARKTTEDTPVQAALNPTEPGRLELDLRFADALLGLDAFSHAWLMTWLGDEPGQMDARPGSDAGAGLALRQVPFLLRRRGESKGIFATRGPRRPTPIGLSLVRLDGVESTTVHFRGVDLVDRTRVVDLKPFVARFDTPSTPSTDGWFDTVDLDVSADDATPRGLR